MISKENKLYISVYCDAYGALLSDKSREMVKLYYDCDLSLQEIAEQFGVSRQAVRDALQRAEAQLREYESALRLVERREKITAIVKGIMADSVGEPIKSKLEELTSLLEENNGGF